jgi:hypothetical protein
MPGETRALATIGRILHRYGEEHLRLVLTTLVETTGNHGLITEITLWAVSDLLWACPHWVEDRTSEWLEAWDRLPFGQLIYVSQELRGHVSQRAALVGLVYSWLRAELDPEEGLTEHAPRNMRERHRLDESEIEKGRPAIVSNYVYRTDFEKLAIGHALLDAKKRLPYRGFQDWVRQEAGLSPTMARICMRMAKDANGQGVDEAA